ncbi:TDT family transporter [Streptomyces orinoci]|uniref:TDT family transporter n=1 Tax=Streptomyces orinoci TaxID=67339 RepID=A0ABV3K038_STRON|nr:TDT family transporter [Streptomyces orinoci]
MTTLVQPGTTPLPRAGETLRHFGPNWYATVMGTAIVAAAGAALPTRPPESFLRVVWALSALLLLGVLVARAGHWARHRDQGVRHLADPAVAPFYGCLAMALLAVGGATLSVGSAVLGRRTAVAADGALWLTGTVLGLAAAAGIPYLMVTRHRVEPGSASPVWLLPVVAPMVSAALGPALVEHLPAGQWREALLLGCYALFGLSLLMTLLLLPLVFSRLIHHGPLPAALTPALFLVLGPLGQSTTAVNNLADAARYAVGAPLVRAMGAFAVLYGVPVTGFALLWLAFATAMVVRAARRGMSFSMTWWAFTFPLGTCVTGAAGLSRHTGLHAFGWLALGLYALLVAAWATASARTLSGLFSGRLLAAPRPAPVVPAPTTARTR